MQSCVACSTLRYVSNATDTLMSAADAADLLEVPRSTVSRWARAGKIPAIRTIGGHWRFRRADIEQHIREVEQFRKAAS